MVLIVDDTDALRRVMAILIADEGYEVEQASCARDALVTMRERKPHCVIVDGHMPEVDGIDMLRIIRADPTLASARVILFSADPGLREPAMAAGADAFVEKCSLDFAVLWRALQRFCHPPAMPSPPIEPAQQATKRRVG